MSKAVLIKVDSENNANKWWDAAWQWQEAAKEEDITDAQAAFLAYGQDEVTVPAEDAAAFRTWAEKLPGWAEGPEYARHPVTFNDA